MMIDAYLFCRYPPIPNANAVVSRYLTTCSQGADGIQVDTVRLELGGYLPYRTVLILPNKKALPNL